MSTTTTITTDPEVLGNFLRALKGEGGPVLTTCWCERKVVSIPLADFRDGIGGTCDKCA